MIPKLKESKYNIELTHKREIIEMHVWVMLEKSHIEELMWSRTINIS